MSYTKKSQESEKKLAKNKRKQRIRKKILGTQERPRLSVFKASKHVYCQVIDDLKGHTLVSSSSFEKGNHRNASVKVCEELGVLIAERCKAAKIEKIVFDKNGNKYHGRVKAVAEGARKAGLNF